MNDLKPLTQAEIDAVPDGILEGWTVKSDGWLHDEPDSYLGRNQANAITKLVRKLLSAEQEERHPLFCGYVEIKGVKRELRTLPPKAADGFHHCPNCDFTFTSDPCEKCGWGFFAREGDVMRAGGDYTLWIAPAPKEPECKTCGDTGHFEADDSWLPCPERCNAAWEYLNNFVTRKGEQDGK